MTSWNWVIEHLATAAEAIAWVTICLSLVGVKKDERIFSKILIGVTLQVVVVGLLNKLTLFSFATPVLVIVLFSIYSFVLVKERFLYCITSSVITVTAMSALEYIIFFSFGILSENPVVDTRTFTLLMTPGIIRYTYLITSKALGLNLAFCIQRKSLSLSKLSKNLVILLLTTSSCSYLVTNFLVSQILSASVLVLQTAVIISMIFIFICILVVIVLCFLATDYRAEKEQNELLTAMNELTESNYRKLSALQKQMSKLNHDFTKHIQVIQGLLHDNKNNEANSYIAELLKVPTERAVLCKSGNSVIDAVINSKIAETEQKKIQFTYQVSFALKTNISSVDLCTVLGNQIDNAIEACEKIKNPNDRHIAVHVYQQAANVAVFQVSNSVAINPFLGNEELKTTKNSDNHLHGLGIPAIREVTARYDGILDTSYQNGEFLSSVMLYFEAEKQMEEYL